MTPTEIAEEKRRIEAAHGPWTSHNVALPGGLCTVGPVANGDTYRLRRFLQIVGDLARRPIDTLRVLDLACLEGLYATEFAKRGAAAVGVEIREANLVKARFVQQALGLDRLEFHQDDVRRISADTYGRFDVTICSGILYHLEAEDAVRLIHTLADMTTGLLIVDTRFAPEPEVEVTVDGRSWWGSLFREHDADATPEQRQKNLWASVDNEMSFWFTRESLVNLLSASGFSSVFECHGPSLLKQMDDRITLVAMRGTPLVPEVPPVNTLSHFELMEKSRRDAPAGNNG